MKWAMWRRGRFDVGRPSLTSRNRHAAQISRAASERVNQRSRDGRRGGATTEISRSCSPRGDDG